MARQAIAVHYEGSLENAEKEFEKRGYEGIRNMRYDPNSGRMGCEQARRNAKNMAGDGLGCYEYEGHEVFPDGINVNRCRIYLFEYEQYTGKPGDGVHKQNCRNCG